MPFDDTSSRVLPSPRMFEGIRTLSILRDARRRMARGLWIQASYGSGNQRCLVGWLDNDRCDGDANVYRLLENQIGQRPAYVSETRWEMMGSRDRLICFNDEEGRTKAEVLALLDRAISFLEANHAV